MKFGITERGDAGRDFSWANNLREANIIITKHLSEEFIEKLLPHKKKCILHAAITGYGGTIVEPNNPSFVKSFILLDSLIKYGFPPEQIVLRIDPIIPTDKGIVLAEKVINFAQALPIRRIRFSFLDMYPHVKRRFAEQNLIPPYSTFHAPKEMQDAALCMIRKYTNYFTFESCAEDNEFKCGCISEKDFQVLGIPLTETYQTGLQRPTCLCLNCKTELLTNRKQCPNACLYCYWR